MGIWGCTSSAQHAHPLPCPPRCGSAPVPGFSRVCPSKCCPSRCPSARARCPRPPASPAPRSPPAKTPSSPPVRPAEVGGTAWGSRPSSPSLIRVSPSRVPRAVTRAECFVKGPFLIVPARGGISCAVPFGVSGFGASPERAAPCKPPKRLAVCWVHVGTWGCRRWGLIIEIGNMGSQWQHGPGWAAASPLLALFVLPRPGGRAGPLR